MEQQMPVEPKGPKPTPSLCPSRPLAPALIKQFSSCDSFYENAAEDVKHILSPFGEELKEMDLSLDDVLGFDEEEWRHLENSFNQKLSIGQSLRLRRYFKTRSAVQQQKHIEQYVSKLVKSLMDGQDVLTAKKASLHARESVIAAVQKLYDEDKCVGTIVFFQKDLAMTAFHSVLVGGEIKESSLRVEDCEMKHIVSYPYYDLSLYKIEGRDGKYLDLAAPAAIAPYAQFFLISYPSIFKHESESDPPVVVHGRISRIGSDRVLGEYDSFPNSSGGAVVSVSGKLMGIHMDSVYYQDDTHFQPPDHEYDCKPFDAIRSLKWDGQNIGGSEEDALKSASTRALAMFAAQNVHAKGHLGSFLPIQLIKPILQSEGLIPSGKRKRG